MRAVVQRVTSASVSVDGEVVGAIGPGLAVLLGIAEGDDESDVEYIVEKIVGLRVFDDAEGRMNLSLLETGRAALVVSQFTLYGDARKGRRPSYSRAASPRRAERLYEECVRRMADRGACVKSGRFGAEMLVTIAGDGPVTILLDSERIF